MPDHRCFCEKLPESVGAQIELSPEESNHLVAANRAREGDSVRIFDGKGTEADAILNVAHKRKARLTLSAVCRMPRPPFDIALAQALPKGKLIESIIKKATEIGIQTVYPITSSRVEAKIDAKKADSKNAKWELAAIEGAKQSGNPYPVEVKPLLSLDEFLAQSEGFQLKLIASLQSDAAPLQSYLEQLDSSPHRPSIRSVIWLIGPEGDFSPEEYAKAHRSGFLPTSLGTHVMRSETAALHALSITQHELSWRNRES